MDCQTALQFMELFEKIREERSKLVAENDENNADIVAELTAAMRVIMKEIVRLVQGTNWATAPPAPVREKESSLVEKAGLSMAIIREDNRPAVVDNSDPLCETSRRLAPVCEKQSRLTETTGPSVATFLATIRDNNKSAVVEYHDSLDGWRKISASNPLQSQATASTAIPHAPVTSRMVRQQTPLGSFRAIMKPGTNFLEDTLTRLSSMHWDSRKKLASTSSAIYNLIFPNLRPKAPAAQDQQATPTKNEKKANEKTTVARKNRKLRKQARETNSFVGDRPEDATPYQAVKQGKPKTRRKKSAKPFIAGRLRYRSVFLKSWVSYWPIISENVA